MKKKCFWQRKKDKRMIKQKDRGLVEWIRILYHFFEDFTKWIEQMKDPRNQSYITYTQSDFV